ncbi:MAG TPA: XdhC/CoxI family protein, partial [Chitinophagaceae bacterium]|nr:XdhC/CoxI family protein [Chitinophagaceae bacterium]
MKEIRDILRAFDEAQSIGKQTALATVVHVEGSSYRRPGARMLIEDDGQLTGAISGGCLEGDALRKALLVMTEKRSRLVTYDTMDDDDAKFGVGLGCNGIIQVLIEPIDIANPNNPIQYLKAVNEKRQKGVLITLFSLQDRKDPQYGTCLLVKEDGILIDHTPVLKDVLLADANDALINQTTSFKNYISDNHNLTAFIEVIKPPVAVIIIGAGNDVMPVVDMADILGWEATVVDGRANYAKKERFVSACQVLVAKPEQALDQIDIDEQTVFLLMTHNYNYDMAMLRQLLQKNVAYIGMLGPKKKRERMLNELREEGLNFTDQQLSVLHSPVGLDIGAETSEEIALSILSEIRALFAGKDVQSLRTLKEVIHPRSATIIEEVKLSPKSKIKLLSEDYIVNS